MPIRESHSLRGLCLPYHVAARRMPWGRLTGGCYLPPRPRAAAALSVDLLSFEMLEALIYYARAEGGGGAT
jgi:hypothetical protein